MESSGETPASTSEETPKDIVPPKSQEKQSLPVKDARAKRSKKEERQHKKEDRSVEYFLKSLDGIASAEDKLTAVSKKFNEVADENRRLQAFIHQSNKRLAGVLKEKEQLQLECNRTVLVKSKLENLCRELQKQNKCIKEESLLKIREEEERRKETQGKFQTALSEITTLLQQNNEKNNKLRDDNISMSTKFKSVVEKYELREQQVEKMAKQMSLEQQLSEAKLAKAGLEAQADKERLMSEIAQLKLELSQYHARMVESQGTEASLRSQLTVYTDKYDEFQNALTKSNQVFGGFKGEIEKMSKKIIKLEKECISWKKRWESSQVALLEMATDKRMWDERAAASDRQLNQMQRLCRSMQAERTLLLNTLKEHNIERPPLPVLPPAPPTPAPQPAAPSKVDAMAANCAQLKQSLAQLQNQLNVLTIKKEEENQAKQAEQQPSGKSKKGKGKKNKTDKEKAQQQENVVSQDVKEEKITEDQNTVDSEVKISPKDDSIPVQSDEAETASIMIKPEESVINKTDIATTNETKVDSIDDKLETKINDIEVTQHIDSIDVTQQSDSIEVTQQTDDADVTQRINDVEVVQNIVITNGADTDITDKSEKFLETNEVQNINVNGETIKLDPSSENVDSLQNTANESEYSIKENLLNPKLPETDPVTVTTVESEGTEACS